MPDPNKEITAHELVIVRRRHDGDGEGHHGGVWKIAYADFMTAMMTFFLVMWLVNAADKKTITHIATYFNPIKLSDKTPSAKGLNDPTPEPSGVQGKDGNEKSQLKRNSKDNASQVRDEMLFRDPFGVLKKLSDQAAREAAMDAPIPASASKSSGTVDPFLADPNAPANEKHSFNPPVLQTTPQDPDPFAAPSPYKLPSNAVEQKNERIKGEKENQNKVERENQNEQEKLSKLISKALEGIAETKRPNIQVQAIDEGLIISLNDEANFEMFGIASAEPNARLVAVMERLAPVIQSFPGQLIIRGHTDGRQYKQSTFGNWRLSMDRASMVYFMLLRGKVDESRFLRLEGAADRILKVANATAAENRRIEILIKKIAP